MTEPERRRKRPTVSCTLCRKRKIRCNRETPCSNCTRSRNGVCVYENQDVTRVTPQKSPENTQAFEQDPSLGFPELHYSMHADGVPGTSRASPGPRSVSQRSGASSINAATGPSQPSPSEVESMKGKIRELEEQLSKVHPNPTLPLFSSSYSKADPASRISEELSTKQDSCSFGQSQFNTKNVMHKTRLFGQSHWSNGILQFQDILKMIMPYVRDETSKASSGLRRCKSLAKTIKSQRTPPWPSPPTSNLPSKDVADELVDCYLRTTESIYRILHIPTFIRDYEALWVPETKASTAFLIQLKLVLAIGATTLDGSFSLRTSAYQWVYEAQTWLSEPGLKSRLSIQSLQTELLLLVAREAAGVGKDLIWISVGTILRTAIYMGLNRDPSCLPKRTVYLAEMRRRLWNSILEIVLQSSMTSGGPPLISLDMFDTKSPGNFDDDQIEGEDPRPKSETEFTQSSIAIALRQTFATRLAIAKYLNDLGSPGTYNEMLRLDAECRTSYRALRQSFQKLRSNSQKPLPSFGTAVVDFIMNRYLSSLHIPFCNIGLHESSYAFSRKVVAETALKIWRSVNPSPASLAARSQNETPASSRDDDMARFALSGFVFFRTAAIQASFLIALELRALALEEESLGPVTLRPDLLSVLDEAKDWFLRCMEAGETNIKGYLLMCLAAAQIEGLIHGLASERTPELLLKIAEEAEERCIPILEEKLVEGQTPQDLSNFNQSPANMIFEMMEDWDFMMSDALWDFDSAESINRTLGSQPMQGVSLF